MALKISVILCTTFLLGETFIQSKITEQTWYQTGAFLKVVNGRLTVELPSNDSKLTSLDAEGKGIVRLDRGFARISSLEWFSLEDNFIEKIENSVFEGFPELIYLNLARNRIEFLEPESFKGLSKLKILILNHNTLKDSNMISINHRTLPMLQELYLQYNQLGKESVSSYYIQKSSTFRLCHYNLRHLYLSHNSIESFSEGDHLCLSNLIHLYVEDNGLVYFDIGEMPLEALSLDGNLIRGIPNVNPHLKFLSLARNRIERISNLKNRNNLVRLILSNNQIAESSYSFESFQNLSSLDYLALDHNRIASIPVEFFYNLRSLRNLYLGNNEIANISPQGFANLPALQELSLNNNRLTSFPGNASFSESNLEYLDLSNNMVENVSDLQANMIPKLKVLKLGGNPLQRIEPLSVSSDTTILL